MTTTFAIGAPICYNNVCGIVTFICDQSLSFCLNPEEINRRKHINVVVYRNQWNKIKLQKQSTK